MRKLNYNHQDQWEKEDRMTQSPILIEKAELEGKQNQVISRTKPYVATEVHNNLNNLSLTANGKLSLTDVAFN